MAICRRPGKASEGENPTILRSESDDELSSTFDLIFGLVPRICHGILILSIADARDRPEHDEREVLPPLSANINPAILPGFLLPKSTLDPFLRLRAATLFSGKTLRAARPGRNSGAGYRNSEKINFFNNLGRRNSSFCGKNSFLDL
jgi:hypothetical protein